MIFRVSEIGHKKKEEKKGLSFLCVPPLPIFFRAVVSVMGRIKQHFLDQGLTAKDVPLAFACVLFVFFFCCFLSLTLVLLCLERRALVLTTVFGARFNERNELVY